MEQAKSENRHFFYVSLDPSTEEPEFSFNADDYFFKDDHGNRFLGDEKTGLVLSMEDFKMMYPVEKTDSGFNLELVFKGGSVGEPNNYFCFQTKTVSDDLMAFINSNPLFNEDNKDDLNSLYKNLITNEDKNFEEIERDLFDTAEQLIRFGRKKEYGDADMEIFNNDYQKWQDSVCILNGKAKQYVYEFAKAVMMNFKKYING